MVWGESNSRDFLDWADFCRNNSIKQRGILTTNGPNFANDKNSSQYNSVKTTILDVIQKNRSISIQQLYNILPDSIVANPTSKHVILQLYFEDNLQIQGQQKNNDSRESNFVVVFVKKQQQSIPKPQMNKKVERKQSNIEDLIDNNWRTTGRKLKFDKMEKEEKKNLNINLKKTNPTTTNKPAEKPNIDVRNINKFEPPKEETIRALPKENNKVEITKNNNINYIQVPIFKPEPEKIVEPPSINLNLHFKPEPPKKEIIFEDKIFYGLSAFDLYYIEAFLTDAIIKERKFKTKIDYIKQKVRLKADIKYLEEKQNTNIAITILILLSCLIIIGIIILAIKAKNKIRKKAIKIYNENLKMKGYDNLKKELKEKYSKIIDF
ncbi:hypothetical protein [Spiroplasma taiwanense]|uniref:Uncharacterized protein n=1 Tax=Spiroplasma taiwanense CT-1 TaxID=1276220 RepID=S5LYJ4_9MOLU|nr:hypothetical protein [Spiroplasma taiwanense]AGR41636.1 hypothetical protein STAIW_v1c10530 [Spiroplasma taiwanense CT-1]